MLDALPDLATVAEVSNATRLGRNKLYELVKQGAIPSVRFGRTVRIPRDALVRWIEAQAASRAEYEPARTGDGA